MGLTPYHRPAVLVPAVPAVDVPAVAVVYAAGGLVRVDGLLLNRAAVAAVIGLERPGLPCSELELLYDPQTGHVGIRPWLPGSPPATSHGYRRTARVGPGHDGAAFAAAWPWQVDAPQFLGCWKLPPVPAHRPAAARLDGSMLVFDPWKRSL